MNGWPVALERGVLAFFFEEHMVKNGCDGGLSEAFLRFGKGDG